MEENIVQAFFQRLSSRKRKTLLRFRGNGFWEDLSWNLTAEKVRQMAAGLSELGASKGSRIGILSKNRHEWFLADFGILAAGAVSVPIYPTLLAPDIGYILNHCEAEILFVEDTQQLQKIQTVRRQLPKLKKIVSFEPTPRSADTIELEDLKNIGRRWLRKGESVEAKASSIAPEDLATLVYTSGTTGPPKGSRILHKNILSVCRSLEQVFPFEEGDVHLSYLPLAHVYERIGGHFFVMYAGGVISYARSFESLIEDAQVVKPTIFLGVPRVFEKMAQRMNEQLEQSSPLKRSLVRWAQDIGKHCIPYLQQGAPLPPLLRAQSLLAEQLVYQKLRNVLGGKVRTLISAAAPLSPEIQTFFHSLGFTLLEGYGLTETTAPATLNLPGAYKIGTVGKPLPGVEIKIARDSEILIRGENVFGGYFQDPASSKEALKGGWLHTGDLGQLDAEGFLTITDRKKDILITAGGKNIAPQNIENRLKAHPLISQAVVLGDRKPYLVALLALSEEELTKRAQENGWREKDPAELVQREEIRKEVAELLAQVNSQLARYETIKKYELLPRDFSVESGELTPTLKVKRRIVNERFQDLIQRMYA